eukprot:7190272-Pyramimonas_sp.AAC.1
MKSIILCLDWNFCPTTPFAQQGACDFKQIGQSERYRAALLTLQKVKVKSARRSSATMAAQTDQKGSGQTGDAKMRG